MRFLMIACAIVLLVQNAQAQQTVRVGVYGFWPSVVQNPDNGNWEGDEVQLIRRFAADTGRKVTFVPYDRFGDLLKAAASGDVDIAAAGTTVTAKREEVVDFSHPFMVGELAIASPNANHGFFQSIGASCRAAWPTVAVFLVLIIVFAHLVWLLERGQNGDFRDSYLHGILDGAWYVFIVFTTNGFADKMAKRGMSRVLTVAIVFVGIGMMVDLVATIAALKVGQQPTPEIATYEQLNGAHVAALRNTTGFEAAVRAGARVVGVSSVQEAHALLKSKQVQAVVHDSLPLRKLIADDKSLSLATLGNQPQHYAFVLPAGSPLIEDLNRSLLGAREAGDLSDLLVRGAKP